MRGLKCFLTVPILLFFGACTEEPLSDVDGNQESFQEVFSESCSDNHHPHIIDLGLSVKWMCCNVGAAYPSDNGYYFAWGEIETKEDYTWETYRWCNGGRDKLTKYNNKSQYGIIDNKTTLDAADDIAHFKFGGAWRISMRSEMDELISTRNNSNYQWVWESLNGHNGWLVTYLVNNNSIFLPAAGCWGNNTLSGVGSVGYYWSSSICDLPTYACALLFYNDSVSGNGVSIRSCGLSIRPVLE